MLCLGYDSSLFKTIKKSLSSGALPIKIKEEFCYELSFFHSSVLKKVLIQFSSCSIVKYSIRL